jgi:hypothetical protein
MLFAAATQGYFLAKSRLWETAALLLIAFTLFRPGYWLDYVQPPFDNRSGTEAAQIAETIKEDGFLRILVKGPDFDNIDKITEQTIMVSLGKKGAGEERLSQGGLLVRVEDDKAIIDEPLPGTPFFVPFQTFDFYGDEPVQIEAVQVESERIFKEIFYIPALLLLMLVVFSQRKRQTTPAFWVGRTTTS